MRSYALIHVVVRGVSVCRADRNPVKVAFVRDIPTNSPTHPHGIKVRLTNGLVGRVKRILGENP